MVQKSRLGLRWEMSKKLSMFNPAHPGELIRETINGIIEDTGKKLTVED
jgi:hypothetical protein